MTTPRENMSTFGSCLTSIVGRSSMFSVMLIVSRARYREVPTGVAPDTLSKSCDRSMYDSDEFDSRIGDCDGEGVGFVVAASRPVVLSDDARTHSAGRSRGTAQAYGSMSPYRPPSRPSCTKREEPKSTSFTTKRSPFVPRGCGTQAPLVMRGSMGPSLRWMSTFSGLMSRCTMCLTSCRYASADRMCAAISLQSRSDTALVAAYICRLVPFTNSSTMQIDVFSWMSLCIRTQWLELSSERTSISVISAFQRVQFSKPLSVSGFATSFTAYLRPVATSSALYTMPWAPSPIFFRLRKPPYTPFVSSCCCLSEWCLFRKACTKSQNIDFSRTRRASSGVSFRSWWTSSHSLASFDVLQGHSALAVILCCAKHGGASYCNQ
eukprot:Rhum_TRINITY_DN2344_c0_g1::Rhum_TRINITY_DN2344_c0_g1_i1::g.6864::m.6864